MVIIGAVRRHCPSLPLENPRLLPDVLPGAQYIDAIRDCVGIIDVHVLIRINVDISQ